MEEQKKMTASPNYEALYYEYIDKYNCLLEKYSHLEAEKKAEHEQNVILKAQMEVVRIIFER